MKRKLALALVLSLAIGVFAGCSKPAEEAVGNFTDGVYEGVGEGYNGNIKVSVKVENGKITAIDLLEMEDTPGIGDKGAEETIQKIIEAQSTEIEAVSGATVSSDGTIEAVEVALGLREAKVVDKPEETKADPEPMTFVDGTYEGSAAGFKSDIKVKVVVEGTKIVDIEILENNDTEGMGDVGAEEVVNNIIKFQSTEVDVKSGATVSSEATMAAVVNALNSEPISEAANTADNSDKVAEEKPADKPVEKPADKPADKPVEKPADKPAEKPQEPAKSASGYKDGTYTGKGDGFYGDIQMKVTIKDGKISSVTIDKMDETEGIGDVAIKKVAEDVVAKQSADVSVVSGATISSEGAIKAIKAALSQAK